MNSKANHSRSLQDCLFLSAAVLLSLILYVGLLGFYSDDWSFLGYLSLSQDQSLGGLFRSINSPNVQMRPVQVLYLAGLYKLFGDRPPGYHWVNSIVFLIGILLFYFVLKKLRQPRSLAIAVPLFYALMPHYSTNRFWYAAFQINLSMCLYFLSFYSDLNAIESPRIKAGFWRTVSLISLVFSALAYEVFMPLFFLNPLLIWHRDRAANQSRPRIIWLLFGLNWIALAATFVFKTISTTRLGEGSTLSRMMAIVRQALSLKFGEYDYGLNIKQAIAVHYGVYGIELPHTLWQALSQTFDWRTLIVSIALGCATFYYLNYLTQPEIKLNEMLRYVALGLVVFGLGYAVFLTNYNVGFPPAGILNRTASAAAVGTALSIVGGIGLLSGVLRTQRSRQQLFCALIAFFCASGCLVNNIVATFWIDAYQQEQVVLSSIRRQFPALPADSAILLDGVCPYIGPAVVFESSWDLAGALMMIYRDYSLQADVITPRLTIEADGISTLIYGIGKKYEYDRLLVYHFGRNTVHPITDLESAQRYFQDFPTHHNLDACPTGYAGFGVPIF